MNGVEFRKIEPAFSDDRGHIMDLCEEQVGHVGLITFTAGAVRARHYHKKSTQYTYTLEGKIELTVYPKDKPELTETIIMDEGSFVSIAPEIVHVYKALDDSVIIDMTTLSRNADGYEADTVRVEA